MGQQEIPDAGKTTIFQVYHPGEPAAGLHSYGETVDLTVYSGDPGGDPGEFEEFVRSFLEEWFDGAEVTIDEQP